MKRVGADEYDEDPDTADDAELGELRHEVADAGEQTDSWSGHAQFAPFVMLRTYGSRPVLPRFAAIRQVR